MLYEITIHNLKKEQAELIINGLKDKEKYSPEMTKQVIRISQVIENE